MYLSSRKILAALESTGWLAVWAVVLRATLEVAYLEFVSPIFEYAGFVVDIDYLKYVESWVLYLLLIYVFPKKLDKASDYLMAYMLFAFLAPLLVFYGLSNASREHLYVLLLGVMLISLFRSGKPFRIPTIKRGPVIALVIMGIGIVVVTAWMVRSGGLMFFNLDVTRVYEFRREVGGVINQGVMGYLIVWATKVFGPVLLAVALWRKKYFFAVAVFALHILWFGISSHKSVVVYPLLVFFLWMWFRNSKALAMIPIGMSLAVLSSLLFFIISSDILIGSMLIRRAFFVPSYLTFTYYEFFSHNPFVFWSNSITSGLIRYPYDLGPAELIGRYLNTESWANNSFLATGYMHAGIPGVAVYGILCGALFRFIDSLAHKGVPPWVAVSSVIVPAHALVTSADFLTALLTHGIGIALLILLLLRSSAPNAPQVSERAR